MNISAATVLETFQRRMVEAAKEARRPTDLRKALRKVVNDSAFWRELLEQQRLVERKIATGRTTPAKELANIEREEWIRLKKAASAIMRKKAKG